MPNALAPQGTISVALRLRPDDSQIVAEALRCYFLLRQHGLWIGEEGHIAEDKLAQARAADADEVEDLIARLGQQATETP